MLVLHERVQRASSFEILASPDPAVPHRILDQFTNLNLVPSRFSVRQTNARTAAIHIVFEELDAEVAKRIGSRLRRIVGVKKVELSLAIRARPLEVRSTEDAMLATPQQASAPTSAGPATERNGGLYTAVADPRRCAVADGLR